MIPKIIHQLWKTDDIPSRYRYWQSSWKRLNPGFEYRLWTNQDLEQFISNEVPQWEEVFWSYSKNICRTDLARYLILQRLGGIYADIDYECLCSLEGILSNQRLVFGSEPESHSRLEGAIKAGLNTIICNAFIASESEHPFWEHLLKNLHSSIHHLDPLESTGPFLVTRSFASYGGTDVTLLPSKKLFPISKEDCWSGKIDDLVFFEEATQEAIGVHYWEGSWFHHQGLRSNNLRSYPFELAPFLLNNKDQIGLLDSTSREECKNLSAVNMNEQHKVSCLMVSKGDPELLRASIECFRRQTYANRELIIVSDKPAQKLQFLVDEFSDQNICWILGVDSALTLGELRNISVDYSQGQFICQWDDDDLYDPSRIAFQIATILALDVDACFLDSWLVWWPARKKLAISGTRIWEGSLLIKKELMVRYPAMSRGEDSILTEQILATCRVATLHLPRLYIYRVHDSNTFHAGHFEEIFKASKLQYEGQRYLRVCQELHKRVPLNLTPKGLNIGAVLRSSAIDCELPRVIVMTPMKNVEKYLPRYFELFKNIHYPKDKISLAILEGDSSDGTKELLRQYEALVRQACSQLTIIHHNHGIKMLEPRWLASHQKLRRGLIAKARNRLINKCLGSNDWVLWLDADLEDYPNTLILDLLSSKKSIVVPACFREGEIFDLNTFVFDSHLKFNEPLDLMIDGIFQPAKGIGRRYLDEFSNQYLVRVDSVGGTALLIDANLHRDGLVFPAFSYRGYIETEGLAAMAHDMGVECWGMPNLKIIHFNN